MMTVGSVTGTNNNMQAGWSGRNMQGDSVSKNIQNQIASAQKKLQDLSSNEEMPLEEKMKKRQEIQQEITNLNQQLRQHQVEQRKSRQTKDSSMEDMLGKTQKTARKAGTKGLGLSKAGMEAIISADTSMKQADAQGSIAVQMKGKAGVLESEIKTDQSNGGNTERKEAELADLKENIQTAEAAQMSHLADANRVMAEAAEADRETEPEKNRNGQSNPKASASEEENRTGSVNQEITGSAAETFVTTEASLAETVQTKPQQTSYTAVDIRL